LGSFIPSKTWNAENVQIRKEQGKESLKKGLDSCAPDNQGESPYSFVKESVAFATTGYIVPSDDAGGASSVKPPFVDSV